jgi:3-oxoacyl-[acyl-carrier protein] reductase
MGGVLDAKVAIVTGGSRGIGRAASLRLARDGARLFLTYLERGDLADAVVGEIVAAGGIATALPMDLRNMASIAETFGRIQELVGEIDILVNNAARSFRAAVSQTSVEQWDEMFATNARGTFLACKYADPLMRDGGRIINVVSGAIVPGPPGSAAYIGSKAAVHQLTKALARELADRKILVNSVAPGQADTDLLAAYPGAAEAGAKATPLQRIGQPDEIADAIAFLAGPDSRWVTGQLLHVNGGFVIG